MVAGVNGVVLMIAAWWFCDGVLVSIGYVGFHGVTASVLTTRCTLVFW